MEQRMDFAGNVAVHREAAAAAPYFPVSLPKLLVMSVFTFGLYPYYWFYRNWKLIDARDEGGRVPILRAIFSIFFCYSLFSDIQDAADDMEIPTLMAPGFLAAAWIGASCTLSIPALYGVPYLVSFVVLMAAQSTVNKINRAACPEHDPNRRFTLPNIAWMAGMALCMAYALYTDL
jgi:hypothetical protein